MFTKQAQVSEAQGTSGVDGSVSVCRRHIVRDDDNDFFRLSVQILEHLPLHMNKAEQFFVFYKRGGMLTHQTFFFSFNSEVCIVKTPATATQR